MKIAILILAHKNPEQLQRLVNTLKQDFEVFIHFDKNASIDTQFKDEEHVHILKKRYATNWGSYRIILAEIELLKAAFRKSCDYYFLISGQDLPVMNNKDMINAVRANYTDYINFYLLPTTFWGKQGGKDRLQYYWSNRAGDKSLVGILSNAFFYAIRHIQIALKIRRKLPFQLYGGAQWFNLRKETVAYILEFLGENEWYIRRYKHTRAADEIFFQTLLHAFDFKNKPDIVNAHKRYIDWSSGPEYPRVLRIADYGKIITSGEFFARKFDEHIDAGIIDRLLTETSS